MRVKVRNFGPIREADLNLGKKNIVVGSNASGKTFISTLMYFLLSVGSPMHMGFGTPLPFEIRDNTVHVPLRDFFDKEKDYIKKFLLYIFNVDKASELITWGENESSIETDYFKISLKNDDNVDVTATNDMELSIPIRYEPNENIHCHSQIKEDGTLYVLGKNVECASMVLPYMIFLKLVEGWSPTVFISTERVALLSLFPLSLNVYLPPYSYTPSKRLSTDFLRFLYGTFHEEFYDFTFSISDTGLSISKGDRKIPPSLVSTGIYQLLPIEALMKKSYFRSLIIEEPEINLHVDMQIKVAKYLSEVEDKNLVITTHSEWIPLIMAFKNRDVNIYEIRDGKIERVEVHKDGTIGELKTINEPEEKQLDEIINRVLEEEKK